MNYDKELDARGLNCPLPILRTKKALTDMLSGQVLKVLATDPGSVKDFVAFSRQNGNPLLSSSRPQRNSLLMKKRDRRIHRQPVSIRLQQHFVAVSWVPEHISTRAAKLGVDKESACDFSCSSKEASKSRSRVVLGHGLAQRSFVRDETGKPETWPAMDPPCRRRRRP